MSFFSTPFGISKAKSKNFKKLPHESGLNQSTDRGDDFILFHRIIRKEAIRGRTRQPKVRDCMDACRRAHKADRRSGSPGSIQGSNTPRDRDRSP